MGEKSWWGILTAQLISQELKMKWLRQKKSKK